MTNSDMHAVDTDDGDCESIEVDFIVDFFGSSTLAKLAPCKMDVSNFLLAFHIFGLFTNESF